MCLIYNNITPERSYFHNRRSTTYGRNIPATTRPEMVELLMYRLPGGGAMGMCVVSCTRSSFTYVPITIGRKYHPSGKTLSIKSI